MYRCSHHTVSVYIVFNNKVLLHRHKRNNMILPIGGHIEIGETPEDACIREAMEETGLNIKLIDLKNKLPLIALEDNESEKILALPFHVMKCKGQGEDYYIDNVYYATATSNIIRPELGETKFVFWCSEECLVSNTEISNNVKKMALEALQFSSLADGQ